MTLDINLYKICENRLAAFGFSKSGRIWRSKRPLGYGGMTLSAEIKSAAVSCRVYDEDGEEYLLHQVPGANGAFVGGVQKAIEDFRLKFIHACCIREEFHTETAHVLLAEAMGRFDENLEFLWKNAPRCAILRRTDSQKWYAVFMVVPPSKLGLTGDGELEIVNMRVPAQGVIFDGAHYFAGWHMNKKSWFSAVLDGPVPQQELIVRMLESRELAK